MSQGTSCALDHRGCVPLQKILVSFGAPISEEQAWALCYSCIQCYQDISVEDRSKCVLITELNHVILNKDGFVQSTTFLPENTEGRSRIRGSSEGKVVAELGVVLYRALDFGLKNDEERDLSPSLDHLIDLMTSAESERGETDDEGIERDSGDSEDELDKYTNFGLHDAMELCISRISKGSIGSGDQTVQDHYRAVVRALVAEAVDLAFFLQNVATSKRFLTNSSDLLSSEGELQHLQCEDWARLWMQVMRQLRDGVKLKKASYTLQPLEYSLTPYEMLMEDIRSRRYNLNKVMENGDIPQKVKKDAHSIILDFIRSRPPLKKASERKLLPPPRKVSSPMELLMESIRKDQKKLRHVQTPVRSRPLSRSISCFRPMAPSEDNDASNGGGKHNVDNHGPCVFEPTTEASAWQRPLVALQHWRSTSPPLDIPPDSKGYGAQSPHAGLKHSKSQRPVGGQKKSGYSRNVERSFTWSQNDGPRRSRYYGDGDRLVDNEISIPLQTDPYQWTLVQGRRPRRRALLPIRQIWVSRVYNGNEQLIKKYMEDHHVKVLNIEKVSHEHARFSSYKIAISVSSIDKVFNESFWPEGVRCKSWHNRSPHDYCS